VIRHAPRIPRAHEQALLAKTGAFTPVIACTREDGVAPIADVLAISAAVAPARLAQRLGAALRIRTLHNTVLRRMETLVSCGESVPALPDSDPLEEATVLVAGRGPSYPELAVAGLVSSARSASRAALNGRDIDGLVIGDGFEPRIVEALLTVLPKTRAFATCQWRCSADITR